MNASDDDRRALSQALRKVTRLAKRAEEMADTDAVKAALIDVRGAAIDAHALAQAIENNTRNAALREVEMRLEQRVGMEAERL